MLWIALLGLAKAQIYLNGQPLSFALTGTTEYIPDAGGSKINGYQLNLAFGQFSWLAVAFQISTGYDVLVFQRQPSYTRAGLNVGHKITVKDYYSVSNGSLISDKQTKFNKAPTAFTKSTDWSVQMVRPLANPNGQNWDAQGNAYSMTNICFYTGNTGFTEKNYLGDYSQCYAFQIYNLISTFRGTAINSIQVNGNPMNIFGYITGNPQYFYLSFYQMTPLSTYLKNPAFLLNTGQTPSESQDWVAFSLEDGQSGDYVGSDPNNLQLDSQRNGYLDYTTSLSLQNVNKTTVASVPKTIVSISVSRLMRTFDKNDKDFQTQAFTFCLFTYLQSSIFLTNAGSTCFQFQLDSINYKSLATAIVVFLVVLI